MRAQYQPARRSLAGLSLAEKCRRIVTRGPAALKKRRSGEKERYTQRFHTEGKGMNWCLRVIGLRFGARKLRGRDSAPNMVLKEVRLQLPTPFDELYKQIGRAS